MLNLGCKARKQSTHYRFSMHMNSTLAYLLQWSYNNWWELSAFDAVLMNSA